MSTLTLAEGYQTSYYYTTVIKQVVTRVNEHARGVTLASQTEDDKGVSHSTLHISNGFKTWLHRLHWKIEAEFENEQDMTLFLLGGWGWQTLDEFEKTHTKSTNCSGVNSTYQLVDLLLKAFSKYVITDMEST